jgi:hypothetical protein
LTRKGQHLSEESRKKISDSKLGRPHPNKIRIVLDPNWLREQRLDLHLSATKIAEKAGCSRETVNDNLRKYNIPVAEQGGHSLRLEIDHEWLKTKYLDEKYSTTEIGEMLGCSNRSVSEYLKIYHIPTRKGMLREKHWNWKGGTSHQRYCPKFNERLREDVRDKFERCCYLCGILESDAIGNLKLSVHHVDYFKNSLCRGRSWAFVPLCRPCHTKTNYNRWYWFNLLINYWAMNPEINFYMF